MPLTGPFTRNGMDARDGWQTYMASINNSVAGRQIQTIVVDDVETQPDAALAKAKQLVEDQKVNVLAGIVATPVCYAVASYVKQAQVPLMVAADCAAQDLTTNEKYVSPYLTRFTTINSAQSDTAADWAIGAGYKKAIVMTLDYGAGIESSDLFASAFIARGGTVVQELHPPLGTNDYGPYLAQMTTDADLLANFIPGADGLKFGQQYKNYLGQRKLQILDIGAGSTSGTNFTQLGDQTIGMIAEAFYSQAYDAPANQAFIKQWKDKNPNNPISEEVADGYVTAQAFAAAVQKVNGNIEDKQAFLNALYATDIDSPRGHLKLDDRHDIIEANFMYQIVSGSNGPAEKMLKTYENVSQFWDRTPEQMLKLAPGSKKGTWVGMTKAKMGDLVKVS
ncbi:MAG: ABC transporter substrate-binding protein [Chloroflexota bacterium]